MGEFPEPRVGLVVSYSYLWSDEAAQGLVEGWKDRPCAIILAIEDRVLHAATRKKVAVAPITHSQPDDMSVAVEIPLRVKEHLGLDQQRSWVILSEVNVFRWPGFDLRPITPGDGRVGYGFLPPKLFDRLIEKFIDLERRGRVNRSSRDE